MDSAPIEATELIGTDGIESVALYLIDHPDAGDVIPAWGGLGKVVPRRISSHLRGVQ
jgi:hypothetical protein